MNGNQKRAKIVKTFKDDREMGAWLTGDGPEALKAEYPPSKYSASLDMVDRQVTVHWEEPK